MKDSGKEVLWGQGDEDKGTWTRTRGQVPCPLFSPMFDALRPTESAKIECGKKHFEALGTEVGFEDIDSFEEFIEEKVVVK